MKKIRYFPFGYRMVDGKIEIVPEEAELIQKIATHYLEGWSLLRLADMAEQSGIPYRDNSNGWNKNLIARILDDVRYWDGGQYPPIFREELGGQLTDMRKSKATNQSEIRFIHKTITCSRCGNRLTRNSRNVRRVYWDCKNCQTRLGPLGDAELLAVVTNKLLTICRIPRLAETEPRAEPSLSLQATRLTNEINQMLNQREVEPDRLLPLILECAAEKYKTCRIRESDHVTLRLLALFREHTEDKELDRELFEQTVKQVILQSDGSVRLRLVNDKVI